MSTTIAPKTTPTIRTYATDLEYVRSEKKIPKQNSTTIATVVSDVPTEVNKIEDGVVPPFHTFSHTAASTNATAVTASNTLPQTTQKIITVGAGVSAADMARDSGPAVIITDTKHKRFSLSGSIVSGVQDWWATKKQDSLKKKTPRYTVPEAQRRKGVIQKATAKTGRASSSDHAAVVARIKATKQINHTPLVAAPVVSPSYPIEPATFPTKQERALVHPVVQTTLLPHISTVRIEPKKSHTTIMTPEVALARESSWETDIQNQVNTLGAKDLVNDSKIIVTGKEFSKIKKQRSLLAQQRATVVPDSTLDTIVVPIPKVQPIIPKMPETTTISAVTTSKLAAVIPVAPVTLPTPLARPKILPIIPPQLINTPPETTISQTTIAAKTPIQTMRPSVFQSEYTDIDAIADRVPNSGQRRFAPPRPEKQKFANFLNQTNNLVFIACGGLLFIVISGLALRSYLTTDATNIPNTVAVTPSVFSDTTFLNQGVSVTTKEDLFAAITNVSTTTDSLTEITITDARTGTRLSANNLFTLLQTSVLFDFKAAITNVAFGNYRGAPWIILSVTDKTTAFGGMLSWEKNLSADLAPLYLRTSRTFLDARVGTHDVRVLKDTADQEVLVYGFISNNTILITSNTTAFLNLGDNLR